MVSVFGFAAAVFLAAAGFFAVDVAAGLSAAGFLAAVAVPGFLAAGLEIVSRSLEVFRKHKMI